MIFGNKTVKPVLNLALQGGGAHGAYTWGVLDYLLEHGQVDFEGVSGTSAGAMNAVVLADGLMRGGRDGAREALAKFWSAVASSVPFELAVRTMDGESVTLAPAMKMLLELTHFFSPYQLNPFDLNPLRDVVTRLIDFERLQRECPLRLFIAATNARTARLRLFQNVEITADALLASACLPTLHHAIEIDGDPYWDGGFSANPAVFPLFYECRSRDILLVLLAPHEHGTSPHTAAEIENRITELSFTTNFLREMRVIAHAREYAKKSIFKLGRLERLVTATRFHLLEARNLLEQHGTETKLVTHLPFLEQLRDMGRLQAKQWMRKAGPRLGKESTFDFMARYY
jgi:NTE family protein